MSPFKVDSVATSELSGASLRKALVERARHLQPVLEKNALTTEADRRVAEENLVAIRSEDLLKIAVPRRLGGLETDIRTMVEVSRELGRGCGATAWVTTLSNSGCRILGAGSVQAQKDVWGYGPDAFLFGSSTGMSTVKKVYDGLIVSGKWAYASGCLHADWGLLAVPLSGEYGETGGLALGLFPAAELVVEDTWRATGMKGSGSHTVVAGEVFLPEHRLLPLAAIARPDRPTPFKEETLYRSALFPSLAIPMLGPLLGMASRALEYVIERAPEKGIAMTNYQPQTSSVGFQASVGRAAILIETAHLQAYSAADIIDEAAREGHALSDSERARLRMQAAHAAESLVQAVDLLMYANGSSAFMEQNPLQRIWRDLGMAARHASLLPAIGAEVYGRALLGVSETGVRFF